MVTETAKAQAEATKKQADATKRQAKQAARTAKNAATEEKKGVEQQAEQTVRAAEKTAERAGRTVSTVLVDSAYASVGATDRLVAFVRSLPDYAVRVSGTGPQSLRGTVEQQFDSLVIRGRQVVDAISTSPATQRAVEQTKTTRAQFLTAAGQWRRTAEDAEKAFEETVDAAGDAADKIGAEETAPKKIKAEVSGGDAGAKVEAKKA